MRRNPKDFIGKKFNRLTIVEITPIRDGNYSKYAKCLCDCGNTRLYRWGFVVDGDVKSCGCLRREQALAKLSKGRKKPRKGFENKTLLENADKKGIYFNPKRNDYEANVYKNNKYYARKRFKDKAEAIAWRVEKVKEMLANG